MPYRIQRRRIKGWRQPDRCVCVTRPGAFGNPFRTAAQFEEWIKVGNVADSGLLPGIDTAELAARREEIIRRLPELAGKDLACYCRLEDQCHADVLLQMAKEFESGK